MFVVTEGGGLSALDQDTGKILWTTTVAGESPGPPLEDSKRIYVGDGERAIVAISPSVMGRGRKRRVKWRLVTGGNRVNKPASGVGARLSAHPQAPPGAPRIKVLSSANSKILRATPEWITP